MTRRRLALVTRRFWPLVGGAEMAMANLACEFRRQGCDVVLLTAQWHGHWPTEVVHREIPVVRLPNPPQRAWGTLRYMLALSRWLRRHRDSLDLVYVSMLKHDAYAALHALSGTQVPVVLRAEGAGETGDCAWQQTARFGGRIRRVCHGADAIIAPSHAIRDELLAAGYPSGRTHFLANGVALLGESLDDVVRDADRRWNARRALAEVNYDLATDPRDQVAIYTGRLHPAKGLFELVQAWPAVLRRFPGAKLWLVGEGPAREELFELILDLELRGSVLMPGSFDDVQELLQASDLFVLPSHEEGMSLSLLEAMAAELPLVATDIPGNRTLVTHGEHGTLVAPRDPAALSRAIIDAWERPDRSQKLAAQARRRVTDEFSLAAAARRHLELFDDWIDRQRRSSRG